MYIERFLCTWRDSQSPFAVRANNIEVPTGVVTVVMGPNGSGKTTFLRGLATHVDLDVRVLSAVPATRFYYVHQQPERMLFPSLTVHEAFYALLAGRHGGFWNMRRLPAFGVLMNGLPDVLRHNLAKYSEHEVSNLSGGYRALVAVAAAAVAFPDCGLLLDEPSAGLDAENRMALAHELIAMASARATPVVVSTHQQDFALALGGTRLEVLDGVVSSVGGPK